MTDKEKAKAYDNALDWMRSVYPTLTGAAKEDAEHYFPELKESRDKRIMENCIHFLNLQKSHHASTFEIEECIAWLEKQGEQKSTDKDEPKFKVGDWCIYNENDTIFQITKVFSNLYRCRTNEGEEYSSTRDYIEKNARFWTNQDAKDGDVLSVSWEDNGDKWEKIVIFKHFYQDGIENSHQPSIEGYGNTFKNGKLAWEDENVLYYSQTWTSTLKPATKEQRDLLFQKMYEAGYGWDVEKKELKKIEQNTAWSEEDERIRYAICDTLDRIDERIMEHNNQLTHRQVKDWLKTIKERMKGE